MMSESTFQELALAGLLIKVYGKPVIPEFSLAPDNDVFKLEGSGYRKADIEPNKLVLATIRAFSVKDVRTILPNPVLLFVPGGGQELDEEDKEWVPRPKESKKWELRLPWPTMLLSPTYGPMEQLFIRGIDGGIEGPRLSWRDGKLCAWLRVWVKVTIFGSEFEWDRTFDECIPIASGCFTLYDTSIGPAKLKVEACYSPPNQLCVEFTASAFGYGGTWPACATIPLKATGETCLVER